MFEKDATSNIMEEDEDTVADYEEEERQVLSSLERAPLPMGQCQENFTNNLCSTRASADLQHWK